MEESMQDCRITQTSITTPYERPELTLVGAVHNLVFGIPGKGFDGPDGLTRVEFEFQADGIEPVQE